VHSATVVLIFKVVDIEHKKEIGNIFFSAWFVCNTPLVQLNERYFAVYIISYILSIPNQER